MKDNLVEFAEWWKSVYREKLAAVYIDERFTNDKRYEMKINETWPTTTIESQGLQYASIIDMGDKVRIQLYPNQVNKTMFINIDKRVVSELIKALEKVEQW